MQVFPLTNTVMLLQMLATWAILQPLQEIGKCRAQPCRVCCAALLFVSAGMHCHVASDATHTVHGTMQNI